MEEEVVVPLEPPPAAPEPAEALLPGAPQVTVVNGRIVVQNAQAARQEQGNI